MVTETVHFIGMMPMVRNLEPSAQIVKLCDLKRLVEEVDSHRNSIFS